MKILIFGSKGQLGTDLVKSFSKANDVIGVSHETVDIFNMECAEKMMKSVNPDVIINAAAYTNVDGCEEYVDKAYRVNSLGARNLAVLSHKINAKLVHISTDFVFDGLKENLYTEFDEVNPLNVYGKSKLAGEEFVKNHCNKYFIIRTSWLYGDSGNNFVKTMLKLSETLNSVTVVDDQIGSPTYTKDLIDVIETLIITDAYGLYHFSNDGECSWNEFAKKIFELSDKDVDVLPISTIAYGSPALRPKYSVMRNYMLELQFNYKSRHWEDALNDYFIK